MAVINGTEGNDAGLKKLLGTAFDDTIFALGGNDEVDAGGGYDVVYGGTGNDSLFGGQGNDQLRGDAGADRLSGGTGLDMADYMTSSAAVTVSLYNAIGAGGDAAGDTYSSIERVVGSVYHDTITGSLFDDFLSGWFGDDILNGLLGNDSLYGGAGNDTITGGGGNDLIDGDGGEDFAAYGDSFAAVSINLATGKAMGGTAQGDTYVEIEGFIGSSHNDTLVGNAARNLFFGGNGSDSFEGGAGKDHLDGGNGIDTASYANSAAGVIVEMGQGLAVGGDAGTGEVVNNFENLIGSSFADDLFGNDKTNRLTGGAGADDLFGRGGGDWLVGGAGRDELDGGGQADSYSYLAASDSTVAAAGRDLIAFSKVDGDEIDLSSIDANTSLAGKQIFSFIGTNAFSAPGQVRFHQSGFNTIVEVNTTGISDADMAIELKGAVNLTGGDFMF